MKRKEILKCQICLTHFPFTINEIHSIFMIIFIHVLEYPSSYLDNRPGTSKSLTHNFFLGLEQFPCFSSVRNVCVLCRTHYITSMSSRALHSSCRLSTSVLLTYNVLSLVVIENISSDCFMSFFGISRNIPYDSTNL